MAEHPVTDYGKQPDEVLLYTPTWGGVREGKVYHQPDGSITTRVANVNGDIGATHYMPKPNPPVQEG